VKDRIKYYESGDLLLKKEKKYWYIYYPDCGWTLLKDLIQKHLTERIIDGTIVVQEITKSQACMRMFYNKNYHKE
jgi:hypothetical protein